MVVVVTSYEFNSSFFCLSKKFFIFKKIELLSNSLNDDVEVSLFIVIFFF